MTRPVHRSNYLYSFCQSSTERGEYSNSASRSAVEYLEKTHDSLRAVAAGAILQPSSPPLQPCSPPHLAYNFDEQRQGTLAAIFAQHIIGQGITSNPQDFLGLAVASRGCRQLLMRVADNLRILNRHDLTNGLFCMISHQKTELRLMYLREATESNIINLRKKAAWCSFCYKTWRVLYHNPELKRIPEEEALVQIHEVLTQANKVLAHKKEYRTSLLANLMRYPLYWVRIFFGKILGLINKSRH